MSDNIKLIKCPNCGANYPENERVCPFCGAENKVLTESEFQSQVDNKENEIAMELSRPQRFVEAIKKYIVFIIIAIVIIIAVAFAVFSFKKENQGPTYEVSEEFIDELQKAVDAKDYDKVSKIVYNNNLYSGRYEAYWWLADVYGEYEEVLKYEDDANHDASPEQVFMSEENRVYSVSIDLRVSMEYCLRVIWKANDYLDKNTSYGTEESIAEIRDNVYSKLAGWGVDDDTVQTMLADYIENGSSTEDDNSLISKCGEKAADVFMAEVK